MCILRILHKESNADRVLEAKFLLSVDIFKLVLTKFISFISGTRQIIRRLGSVTFTDYGSFCSDGV